MPASSTKKPVTAKGAKPAKSGSTAKAATTRLLDDLFRAKKGGGRYRLFYRFDSKTRLIVYAWGNDDRNLRSYGSRTDAYAVARRPIQD